MANSSAPITSSPQSGRRRPTKTSDQERFNTSWTHHSRRADLAAAGRAGALRRTSHAAMAMSVYNTVQTGPKTHAGGVQLGLRSVGYQSVIALTVTRPPSSATPKLLARKISSEPSFQDLPAPRRMHARLALPRRP